MEFWVYQNWTHDRARIHRGGCSFCNNGRGTQPGDSGRNGEWIGPMGSFAEARAVARAFKRADTRLCGFCSEEMA